MNEDIRKGIQMFTQPEVFDILTDEFIIKSGKILSKVTRNEKLNPDKCLDLESLDLKTRNTDKNTVLFKNTIEIIENREYNTIMTLKEYNRLTLLHLWREPVEDVDAYKEYISQLEPIKRRYRYFRQVLLDRDFYPSIVTINILDDGRTELKFKENTLEITNGQFGVLDGRARTNVIFNNLGRTDENQLIQVRFTFLNKKEAISRIISIKNATQLSTNEEEAININKKSTQLARELSYNILSPLYGQIDTKARKSNTERNIGYYHFTQTLEEFFNLTEKNYNNTLRKISESFRIFYKQMDDNDNFLNNGMTKLLFMSFSSELDEINSENVEKIINILRKQQANIEQRLYYSKDIQITFRTIIKEAK